jgi:hypothetical protein
MKGEQGSQPDANATALVGNGKEGTFVPRGRASQRVRNGPVAKAVLLAFREPNDGVCGEV